jgi:hypothetical protein
MLCIFKIGINLKVPLFGVAIAISITISSTVMRWMLVNCTDSLLVALFSIVALTLTEKENKRSNQIILIFVILTSATRFCLLFWIAVGVWHYFFGRKITGFVLITLAFICALPALIMQPSNAFQPGMKAASNLEKIINYPMAIIKITFFEFAELAVLDRLLLALIIISILLAIKKYKDSFNSLFLLFFASSLMTGALNGTIGVNFRYELPVLPFAFIVILKEINNMQERAGNVL